MAKKMSEERQHAIREEGKSAFLAGTSSNLYREGSHAHSLWLDGWLQAKRDFEKNN